MERQRKDHCEVCGISEATLIATKHQHLVVHHINGNHEDNRPGNLLTVCPRDHLLIGNPVGVTPTKSKLIASVRALRKKVRFASGIKNPEGTPPP